ncbi:hypothetical protein CEUSTIGMA_g8941.t1 [Chlamydomonas eustigma]|uniref:Uncharacterized protein n=1 Tax=Chlamydomonas eustigma TaxID=1157962 RepID=A0A250XEM3_9CHLO|nr:hypothetical protein CEUSTIGMA_g8941.t1 [Chlamydomonas eustigma]|eukprot:GAX81513.1 hypothetical protein CEUSTIGMA_g8941.t1 [Chlamydomonas eustigma]
MQVTSLFLHLVPALVSWSTRWHPHSRKQLTTEEHSPEVAWPGQSYKVTYAFHQYSEVDVNRMLPSVPMLDVDCMVPSVPMIDMDRMVPSVPMINMDCMVPSVPMLDMDCMVPSVPMLDMDCMVPSVPMLDMDCMVPSVPMIDMDCMVPSVPVLEMSRHVEARWKDDLWGLVVTPMAFYLAWAYFYYIQVFVLNAKKIRVLGYQVRVTDPKTLHALGLNNED